MTLRPPIPAILAKVIPPLLLSLALFPCAANVRAQQGRSPSLAGGREIRSYPAAEARQGVAVDSRYFYAIDSRRIGKYDRATGRRVGGWEGEENGPIHHLDSGVVIEGRLYAAHSNYPDRPMVSSIEIWDVATMRHVGSHSFGIHAGSGTWVDRHDGSWWVFFANYENEGGEPGRGVEWSVLERYDDQWRQTGGWVLPAELVARMRPYSNSGGVWTSDGRLLLTGHDAPELYVLRLPRSGSVLEWTETIAGTHAGQGIASDPANPNRVFTIHRASQTVRVLELPASTRAPAPTTPRPRGR